ncbi:phosphoribosylaminoimidazole carboxylase [Aliidiomarina taiwanensis]|uniref:Phosphoribosylaminoimidazole carboxylase n=1 Tax=Aliidiomarina taiwanensis TaxID=946228 RepID=A0A432WVP2_9GAMM|nr:ATP-grasp domain-containing protein [Aliidiomarina taiwanensis]RUO37836.1 phosphoribosylaminoimidazole carboxylase [Aliidiomarina taiwanensis]
MKVLILGNGQLGQMLGQASIQLGDECLLINTRTNQVMPVGSHQALDWSVEQAMAWADVVSWEHEQISDAHVALAQSKLLTRPEQIKPLTHRQHEKSLFDRLDLGTAPWQAFANKEELADILAHWQGRAVIKAAEGGYDGKGQWRWQPGDDIQPLLATAGQQPGIVEAMIPFHCEVSIVGARTKNGDTHCYPLVENIHRDGILSHTLAGITKLPSHLQAVAESWFTRLTTDLGYVGTLAIEFFVVGEGEQASLLINEVAPRVHNSGHWSLTGSNCSQFSLHMRAITGAPIPPLSTQPTLMLNVIGVPEIPAFFWQHGQAAPFWYGKEARPGRKVGHINIALDGQSSGDEWVQSHAEQLQKLV